MKIRNCVFLGILLIILSTSCDDEKMSSIVGKWNVNKAEYNCRPFRYPGSINQVEDDLDTAFEFQSDGTLILTRSGKLSNGTYSLKDKDLITSVPFTTHVIGLSGKYSIQELTETKLVLFVERDDTFQDPDTGVNLRGTVRATIIFDKAQ
jgi:hypothetical protein